MQLKCVCIFVHTFGVCAQYRLFRPERHHRTRIIDKVIVHLSTIGNSTTTKQKWIINWSIIICDYSKRSWTIVEENSRTKPYKSRTIHGVPITVLNVAMRFQVKRRWNNMLLTLMDWNPTNVIFVLIRFWLLALCDNVNEAPGNT
jgi:hypothetical protein